jgi:hypothetical protein
VSRVSDPQQAQQALVPEAPGNPKDHDQVASENTKPNPTEALIVLGMHRSGTSALSGVLARLGVQAPKNLIPATPRNPRGFWESVELMKFHDRVLESAGSHWSDWDGFDPGWIDSPVGKAFLADLPSLLKAEYGDARLILVKDPRICRLFPLWATALGELGITPKVVIPLRHPAEVARSLELRNRFTANEGRLLWLRHLLDSESSTRGVARAFVRYADLLHDWQAEIERLGSQLGIEWPRQPGSAEAEINDFLAPELRHHTASDDSPAATSTILRWVTDTYRIIDSLVEDPGFLDGQDKLDAIRREFDETSRIYAPIVQEQRQQFERTIGARDAEARELAGKLEDLESSQQALQQESLRNRQLYDADHKALAELTKQLLERDSAYGELNSRHAILEEREQRLVETVDALSAEGKRLRETVFALDAENKGLREAVVGDAFKIRALENEIEARSRSLAEQHAILEALRSNRYRSALLRMTGFGAELHPRIDDRTDEELLRRSQLFDREWYLSRYPDVRSRSMDPVKHYLKYGAREGRDPCACFSTSGYISRYPDVMAAGVNPLVHYLKYGRSEGRRMSADRAKT